MAPNKIDPQIERRAIGALCPYQRNARKHPPEQLAQIAASIREWSWTMPVLVDEQDLIIAGHGRVEAAKLIEQEIHGLLERVAAIADANAARLEAGRASDPAIGADEGRLRCSLRSSPLRSHWRRGRSVIVFITRWLMARNQQGPILGFEGSTRTPM